MLWWEKPLDIQDPTVVVGGDKDLMRPVTAALWACNTSEEDGDEILGLLWQLMRGKNPYGSTQWLFWRLIRGYKREYAYSTICRVDIPQGRFTDIQCHANSANWEIPGMTPKDQQLYPKEGQAVITPLLDLCSGSCRLARFVPIARWQKYSATLASWEEILDLWVVGSTSWDMFHLKKPSPPPQAGGVENGQPTATATTITTWCFLFRPVT
jgi:hypothetical protein